MTENPMTESPMTDGQPEELSDAPAESRWRTAVFVVAPALALALGGLAGFLG